MLNKKKRTSFCKKIRFLLTYLLCASAFEPKHAVRDKRRKNQPKSRKRDNRIGDDRTSRSRARKHLRNEIEIEQTEQTPVDCTDDYQNIRDNVDNSHNFPSCKQYGSHFGIYAKFIDKMPCYTLKRGECGRLPQTSGFARWEFTFS